MFQRAVLGLMFLSGLAEAQDLWLAAVQRGVGEPVEVRLKTGKTQSGTLLRGDETDLVLRHKQGETMIGRSEVRELRMRTGRSRGRRMLIGGLIGTGAGAAVSAAAILTSATLGGGTVRSPDELTGMAIGGTAAGAGIGIAIGAAIPASYKTIYSAPD